MQSCQSITHHSLIVSPNKTRAAWRRQREALNAEQEF